MPKIPDGKLTIREKLFVNKLAETKNGTESALAVYDFSNAKNPRKSAGSLASETLSRPRVREALNKLLEKKDFKLDTVLDIHKRNMLQDSELSVSQSAVKDYYKLVGLENKTPTDKSVKIAFIIKE